MFKQSYIAFAALGFATLASAQTPFQPPGPPAQAYTPPAQQLQPSSPSDLPPTQSAPVISNKRTDLVCRQDGVVFSVRQTVDGTLFTLDFFNEQKKLELSLESTKRRYPNFSEEWQVSRTQKEAEEEAAQPSSLGMCALMQSCEIQESGMPNLVDCKHEQGNRKRRLTVQLNQSNTYEIKCEEWIVTGAEMALPTINSNSYTAFTKQIVLSSSACR